MKEREFKCPRCGRKFSCTSLAEHEPFPFCSGRCREIDLGKWLTGQYAIPGRPVDPDPDPGGGER